MLKKMFVLLLTCSFLGQYTLSFAAEPPLPSVHQSRQSAQEAVQEAQDKVPSVSIVKALSGAVGLALLATGVQQWRINLLKGEKILQDKEMASLRRELALSKKETNDVFDNWKKALKKKRQVDQKLFSEQVRSKELQEALQKATFSNSQLEREIANLNRFFMYADVDKYAALYGKPKNEIQPLLRKMLREDFSKASVSISNVDVLVLAQKMETILTASDPEKAAMLARSASAAPRLSSNFLFNLAKKLSSKNMLVWGMLLGTGAWLAEDSALAKQLQRLQANPSLLLSLSDEEADMLNQSPAARAICSIIAEGYKQVSALPAEDLTVLAQDIAQVRLPGPVLRVSTLAR